MDPLQAEKRKRIIGRSRALGHCICEPKKKCPCDLFRQKNVCLCAGEKLPVEALEPKLTEYVRHPGCSSKIEKKILDEVLSGLPDIEDKRILVGRNAGDDAGVIQLSKDKATVLTVDVFTPVVDDPYTFGQIAAANSLSDVYAMGGKPEVALSIIGFPVHTLPAEWMREILKGGIDKMTEAGISVIGGHSINDEEIKCGFAVVGSVGKENLLSDSAAEEGDRIVLTKPLGAGIASFARQIGLASEQTISEMTDSMKTLNAKASLLMPSYGIRAGTDITGFGLMGHLSRIVRKSGIEIELSYEEIPLFSGVRELSEKEVIPGGVERNIEAVDPTLLSFEGLNPAEGSTLFCPETSGGLLLFVPKDKADSFIQELRQDGYPRASQIGKVIAKTGKSQIRVVKSKPIELGNDLPKAGLKFNLSKTVFKETQTMDPSSCCSETANQDFAKSGIQEKAESSFFSHLASISKPRSIDLKHKKLMSLALSVATRCEPCIQINQKAALEAGASNEEIVESVELGIAFGGAPSAMLYKTLMRR